MKIAALWYWILCQNYFDMPERHFVRMTFLVVVVELLLFFVVDGERAVTNKFYQWLCVKLTIERHMAISSFINNIGRAWAHMASKKNSVDINN